MPASKPTPAKPPRYYAPQTMRAENGLLYLLRRAQLAVAQCVNDQTDPGGSTLPQWLPLHKVHSGQADTVAELARVCTVDAGSMTRLLDRLEAKGLCRRVRSQTDRRVVHIELTAAGTAVAERVPRILCDVYNRVLAGFTPQEWQQLQALLTRLTEAADDLTVGKDAP